MTFEWIITSLNSKLNRFSICHFSMLVFCKANDQSIGKQV